MHHGIAGTVHAHRWYWLSGHVNRVVGELFGMVYVEALIIWEDRTGIAPARDTFLCLMFMVIFSLCNRGRIVNDGDGWQHFYY